MSEGFWTLLICFTRVLLNPNRDDMPIRPTKVLVQVGVDPSRKSLVQNSEDLVELSGQRKVLLMAEILHQLIGSLSHYL